MAGRLTCCCLLLWALRLPPAAGGSAAGRPPACPAGRAPRGGSPPPPPPALGGLAQDMVAVHMLKLYEKYNRHRSRPGDGNTVRSFKAKPGKRGLRGSLPGGCGGLHGAACTSPGVPRCPPAGCRRSLPSTESICLEGVPPASCRCWGEHIGGARGTAGRTCANPGGTKPLPGPKTFPAVPVQERCCPGTACRCWQLGH